MKILHALMHPEEEDPEIAERMVVASAANTLGVGEFQFLQLAYWEWFGKDLPEALVARLFSDYMLRNEVPHWARHYARLILAREERGLVDETDPIYHRYDPDYGIMETNRWQRFLGRVGVLVMLMVSGLVIAGMTETNPTTILPPYFDEDELTPSQHAVGWGRADALPEARPLAGRDDSLQR